MALGSTQPLTVEFPRGKCGRCVRLTTLPPSCDVVMKSGKINFLEPSGPLKACNGTALPSPLRYFTYNAKITNKSFENVTKFKLFWDDDNSSELCDNSSELCACRNRVQTKFRESLLLFGDNLLSVHFRYLTLLSAIRIIIITVHPHCVL